MLFMDPFCFLFELRGIHLCFLFNQDIHNLANYLNCLPNGTHSSSLHHFKAMKEVQISDGDVFR